MKNRPHQKFADVDLAEALTRAEALIPLLKEQAPAGEAATRVTPRVMAALHESGLMRYHQPRRWGGMELDFVAMMDIPELLARGDASAAWTVVNLAGHHRMLSLYPPRAQEELWGEDPDVGIASGIAFIQGQARRVDGGLVLTGKWGFSSGVDHSSWNMLACVVKADDKPVDWCMCLIPATDYEVIDDWQTLGMRATGSRSVRCAEVFVPDYRVVSYHLARPGHEFPGWKVNPNPMYRIPLSAFAGYGLAGCLIGNAQAALDTSVELVKARSTSYTGARMRDFQTVQWRIAEAGAKIDCVRNWLRQDCIGAQSWVQSGRSLDTEMKLRYRRNAALGVRLLTEAVDSLHELAGAHGIYDNFPLQRIFRDAHAGAAHINFSVDTQFPPWGLVSLGGEFKSPTL
ncbi:MAG: acyl-CoA dehydrogenase [Betaproteobacteria bacterium]|nr:MAG: acyl-CoA dehydrogenase [Betaproteobacteria bacterium]